MNTWMTGGAVVLCGIATWWDLRHRRIPNGLTLPALGIALCLHGATGAGPRAFSSPRAERSRPARLPGYVMRFTGAGDVKLLMAVGAFLSFPQALMAGLIALVLGGVLGLLTALRFGGARFSLAPSGSPSGWPIAPRVHRSRVRTPSGLRVPFGVAIALATVCRSSARTWRFPMSSRGGQQVSPRSDSGSPLRIRSGTDSVRFRPADIAGVGDGDAGLRPRLPHEEHARSGRS